MTELRIDADRGVLIAGAGIAGLTLALQLHSIGIPCTVFEAVSAIEPLGVGINLLPHATRVLHGLGLADELDAVAVRTRESRFYNRFGQLIYTEQLGTSAGYDWPQYSIHRGDLQSILLNAVRRRLGDDAVLLDRRIVIAEQDENGVTAIARTRDGEEVHTGAVLIGCDGVNSAIRRLISPSNEGLRYSGYTMWRGTAVWPPFLGGDTLVRAGWLSTGKMVIYPIRNDVDGRGNQLVNWVAEIESPQHSQRDWNTAGDIADIIEPFKDWTFDWLDVAGLMRATERVLEYPMVDQDPLDRWSDGRITLLGDAAHPMVPRGSNGAGQAILDTASLARHLATTADPVQALADYDAERRVATAQVVLLNRTNPPDAILREVHDRTHDTPFSRVEDVISVAEMEKILDDYRTVAGYSLAHLAGGSTT